MTFRLATTQDVHKIYNLYEAVKGKGYCVWDESYPGMEEINHDTETSNLFVLEEEGILIGAASIVPENELDGMQCWEIQENAAEIARVVINPEYQGKGFSQKLVTEIIMKVKSRNFSAVHLSVASSNIPAYKNYQKIGFNKVGEADMYGGHYFLCEFVFDFMNIALILAGGKGTRMGSSVPKQYIEYKNKPIIVHTLEAFANHPQIDKVCVICPTDSIEYMRELVTKYCIPKVAWIEPGGASRRESSYIGVSRLAQEFNENPVVLIHDGARPNVSERIITENISAAAKFGACETVIPSQDTIAVSEDGIRITGIPERKKMYNVQTPQSFRLDLILKAHEVWIEKGGEDATDDASLLLSSGHDVYIVNGEKNNLKITTGEDLRILYSVTE